MQLNDFYDFRLFCVIVDVFKDYAYYYSQLFLCKPFSFIRFAFCDLYLQRDCCFDKNDMF